MNYLRITAVLAVAFILGHFSVDTFIEENLPSEKKKASFQSKHAPQSARLQPQKIEFHTNNETNINRKSVKNFHFESESTTIFLIDDSKSIQNVNKKKNHSESSSRSVTKTNTFTKKTSPARNKSNISINKNLVTFQSIGTKTIKHNNEYFPAVYIFFHAQLSNQAISLKWLVSYENNIFSRTVNYKTTKIGNNRAILFIDRKNIPSSADSDSTFIEKLKVQLIFIVKGKEYIFPNAKIGKIFHAPKNIQQSPLILKTRIETGIKLSDNYNPILY